ncbi:MAG TPA: 50S ribosomal protein L1 [Candidatus Saccharimonadales bacterium]|nr:50S ribosomal protein L1 [Candidatus Saccharimonadales bacterium]
MKAHGKKYREAAKLIDAEQAYDLAEAIALAQKTSTAKFDASVELHINLGVDPKQADQMVRATVVLPAGTGKTQRVAVIAPTEKQAEAKKAGADLVGEDDLIALIEKGQIDFDVLVATPQVMTKIGKLAKVLGPKGLMPNPKSGTVTNNVAEAVSQSKAGRVEFRIDKQAIIHTAVGKVSFKPADLETNILTLINALMDAKPAAAKGTFVKRMTLTTTMGPGIHLNHTQALAAANQVK